MHKGCHTALNLSFEIYSQKVPSAAGKAFDAIFTTLCGYKPSYSFSGMYLKQLDLFDFGAV